MAGKTIPDWMKSFVNASGLDLIEKTVREVESKTSGEVVPMIVRSSSTKGHLPLQIFLMLSVLCLVLQHYVAWPYVVSGIVISALISFPLAKISWLQRLLLPKQDQANDAFHRAHFEFSEQGLINTKERTGILIFVSLMEHRCVILADRGISEKVDANVWDEIVADLISEIKKNHAAEGFKIAIQKCGVILAKHLPATPKNSDELRNHLIIKD